MHGIKPSVAASGDTSPVRKDFGSLTIIAQVTVDGGYSINTFTGPTREDNLCFTTTDRNLYRRVYAVIGQGGNNGVSPDGIHAALVDALTDDLHTARRRRDGQRIELLNQALDRLETPAQTEAAAEAVAGIRANITTQRARTFADIRDMHAAAVAADRAQLTMAVTR